MINIEEFYRSKYKGSLFVIKAGGRVITDPAARRSLLENIHDLNNAGIKTLLIYGGGHAIDDALNEAAIQPRKINGRRITGPREIKIIQGVMSGNLAYQVSTTMAELGMKALTLSNLPPNWVDVKFRERENPEDYGHDGTITTVHADHILPLFDRINCIVTPCISATSKGAVNINADNVAVKLAEGCQSRKLILLSDVHGVLKNGKTLPYLTDEEIPGLIEDGTVVGGMQVKLENCLHALQSGVRRIHLINGFAENSLRDEIYNAVGPGTMIIKEEDRRSYLNEIETQKAIEGNL